MKHIPTATLAELKEKLLHMQTQLEDQIERTASASPVNDLERLNDNESADDALEDIEILQSDVLVEHLEERLRDVQSALERIEQGSYGVTAEGEEIPVARLTIDPTVQTVVIHEA